MNPDDENSIYEVASDIDDLKTTVEELEEGAASTGEATALKKLKNALEHASDATDALEDEHD